MVQISWSKLTTLPQVSNSTPTSTHTPLPTHTHSPPAQLSMFKGNRSLDTQHAIKQRLPTALKFNGFCINSLIDPCRDFTTAHNNYYRWLLQSGVTRCDEVAVISGTLYVFAICSSTHWFGPWNIGWYLSRWGRDGSSGVKFNPGELMQVGNEPL